MIRPPTLFLAAVVLLGIGGCGDSPVAPATQAASPASSSGSTNITSQQQTSGSARSGTGDILSVLSVEHQVDVATETDGLVVSVAKDEGSEVKAG
jgi:hypothetical protein